MGAFRRASEGRGERGAGGGVRKSGGSNLAGVPCALEAPPGGLGKIWGFKSGGVPYAQKILLRGPGRAS